MPESADMEVNPAVVLTLASVVLVQLLVAALLVSRRRIELAGLLKLLACELVCVCGLFAARRIVRRANMEHDQSPVTHRAPERR